MRGAEERLARRRHASRRRHVRPLLREQLLSVAVLVAVLAVTLVLLGLQWLESSPSTAAPTTTIAPITTPGGSP